MIQESIERPPEAVPKGPFINSGSAGNLERGRHDLAAEHSNAIADDESRGPAAEGVSGSGNGAPEGARSQPRTGGQSAQADPKPVGSFVRRTLGAVGPTLVLLGFAAVFYFGHSNDWRIPKFASVIGTATPESDDWCADHSVPASICVECNTGLMPPDEDFGWCNLHGVHNCVLDHPELAEANTLPSAEQLQDDRRRAETALAMSVRQENNSRCTLYQNRIQFASIQSVEQAGVDIGLVQRDQIIEAVRGNGELVYDPTRTATIAARVPGSVSAVEKNIGDFVRKGELLALVDATAVGKIKSELMRALAEEVLQQKNVTRLEDTRGAVAGARIIEAEAAFAKARAGVLNAEQAIRNLGLPIDAGNFRGMNEQQAIEKLRLLGIPKTYQANIDDLTASTNLLPVVAPMSGTIVDRSVNLGEVVDPTMRLFEIADTSRMWLNLSLPLESIDKLSVGQEIRFTPDGSGRVIEATLDWISTGADQHTRMIDVRATLDNSDGRLRDRTFGTGKVILRDAADATAVPADATHWEGCCNVVFVRDKQYFSSPESPKVFHVRSVRLGATYQGKTEVIAGLLPGEVIAVEGSDVLRAQLLKNGLGAGCCVEE
ncbi:efflux RND transporter periplasmic adaptor subunit [Allorhodopirellula solitaria]|uniref:Cobalt-zinc-cadmium resistance protein CzcB n=1 Tax=Allorhodopirellula solitaria TaxID=2527987 RepID=A0A5C5XT13_9BACT|nr:efflux RND transporter periplasmic adaptor subunit [Allorhodopirellula solitaria]TWT66387.1 Cobalt-zinc-cadmium resistance protein CzcB [Allorhodopirellula solitaria]